VTTAARRRLRDEALELSDLATTADLAALTAAVRALRNTLARVRRSDWRAGLRPQPPQQQRE